MDWIAAILGIGATFILGHTKHWYGFVIFMISSAIWLYIGWTNHIYGLVFSGSGFILTQAYAIYKWRKKHENT